MDLTPAALREITFRGALRGYNVNDVDEFVEKVAVGTGELLEQLRKASERAAEAERVAKEVARSEDSMRRTLGQARKLAEAVLTEARQEAARVTEEAERLLAEARAERSALEVEVHARRATSLAEIEAERTAARQEIEAMVARAAASIDGDLKAEIERLHGVRQVLQLDVAVLTRWMHGQRDAVRNVLVETLAAIDHAAPVDEPPSVSEVDTMVQLAGLASGVDLGAPAPEQWPPAHTARSLPLLPPGSVNSRDSFPDLSDEEFVADLKKAASGADDAPFGRSGQETSS